MAHEQFLQTLGPSSGSGWKEPQGLSAASRSGNWPGDRASRLNLHHPPATTARHLDHTPDDDLDPGSPLPATDHALIGANGTVILRASHQFGFWPMSSSSFSGITFSGSGESTLFSSGRSTT